MDTFQRHVDFGLSVCESVSSFGKKISSAITFDQQGMIEISYLAWTIWRHYSEKVQTKVHEYMYGLGFLLRYLRYIGLCSMDHMNNIIHV